MRTSAALASVLLLSASCVVATRPPRPAPSGEPVAASSGASVEASASASASGSVVVGVGSPSTIASSAAPASTPATTTPAPTASATTAGPITDCPPTFQQLPDSTHVKDHRCACKASDPLGTLYGSGPFSSDSSICKAARYLGEIGDKGGVVTVSATSGCAAYHGGTANGVTSLAWSAHKASFYFPAKGGAACTACPNTFKDIPDVDKLLSFDCTCGAKLPEGGGLYGTGIYTTDSSICLAAKHSGVIKGVSGLITVKKAPGCGSYKGTTANGVTSSSWASYPKSFYVAGGGTGTCP